MTKYVIQENGVIYVKPAKGFTPENAVAILPDHLGPDDYAFLTVSDSVDEQNQPIKVVGVDTTAKATALAEASKASQVAIAYQNMVEDVYAQLYEVFRTRQPETATAEKETWDDMLVNPGNYSSLGLKVDYQLNNADDTELFSPGSALDTDAKITAFATRKLEQVRAYGPYRSQRKQQFYNERETILGS